MQCTKHPIVKVTDGTCSQCEREVKTKSVVNDITYMINDMSFNPEVFVSLMSYEHRTHQQSFTRLCMAWIEHLSKLPDNKIDLRNEASRNLAKEIMEKIDYLGLPTI